MVQVTREDKGVPAAAELGDDNSPLVWLLQRHITSGNKRNSGRDRTGEITHEKWDLSNLSDKKKKHDYDKLSSGLDSVLELSTS